MCDGGQLVALVLALTCKVLQAVMLVVALAT